jgi:epoxyqueuosine reductase
MAKEVGFPRAGVTTAEPWDDLRREHFRAATADLPDGLDYLHQHEEVRFDPAALVDGARSVLCLAMSCAQGPASTLGRSPVIARYARGKDYHKVLRKRLRRLMDRLAALRPEFLGRAFEDAGPILEKPLAQRAGLGWIGEHGVLIVPGLGSYVLLGEIVSNLPLRPDAPMTNRCCGAKPCLRVCPTAALSGKARLDARRCLSYWNNAAKSPPPRELWGAFAGRWFGCDLCQEVCPYNRAVPEGDPVVVGPLDGGWSLEEILDWTHEEWDSQTRGKGIRAGKLDRLQHTAILLAGQSGDASLLPALRRLRAARPEWAEVLDWAIGKISGEE